MTSLRPCLKCGRWSRGGCPDHKRTWKTSDMGPGWSGIRAQVLREQPTCALHYPGCTLHATQVDHIRNRARHGLDNSRSNLQAVCAHCHGIKTHHEGMVARWGG